MEGKRQKGWTIFTIMFIEIANEEMGTISMLIGQGDNQVLRILVPPRDELKRRGLTRKEFISLYRDTIASLSDTCGMEIKKEETWCSSYLFEYSKRYYFKGAEVGGALKKASRVANESNSGLPTLSNRVASVSSAGVSVAGADTRPQAGFFLATLEACIILDSKIDCTVAELAGLTLVPRHLSGLPLVNYAGFCMRGNIDPLTVAISLVMTASRTQSELYGPISRIIEYDENHKDFTLLIKDPYGLPMRVAIQAENFVRRKLRAALKDCVKNELIKPLFDISDKKIEETCE